MDATTLHEDSPPAPESFGSVEDLQRFASGQSRKVQLPGRAQAPKKFPGFPVQLTGDSEQGCVGAPQLFAAPPPPASFSDPLVAFQMYAQKVQKEREERIRNVSVLSMVPLEVKVCCGIVGAGILAYLGYSYVLFPLFFSGGAKSGLMQVTGQDGLENQVIFE